VRNDELEAVLLDFGGTLFSYRDMRAGTLVLLREAVERLGLEPDLRAAGLAYRDASRAAFGSYVPRPYYLHRDVFEDTFRRFAENLGERGDPDWVEWFYGALRGQVLEQFALRAGCLVTIEALRGRGLHVAVVSNIDDDWLLPMLERSGLDSLLDAWTSSEEARSCKPHAAIYRHALDKAGASPGAVLFAGDSREQDIAGARALGMQTALLVEEGTEPPGEGALAAADPHHRIRELPELLAIAEDFRSPELR
jgi:HAD superfamily hydrolase (TIGR01509 family)